MSDFDFINFLMIDDVGRSTKNNERLQDLRDRAADLAKVTGEEPLSWHKFQQETPKEPVHILRNALIGAGIGLALGAIFSVAAAVGLGLGLGAVGAFTDTENTRRNDMIKKYEAYLDGFEASVGRGRGMETGINYRDDHAKQLEEKQAMGQALTMGGAGASLGK